MEMTFMKKNLIGINLERRKLTASAKNRLLVSGLVLGIIGTLFVGKQLYQIEQFNQAVKLPGSSTTKGFNAEFKFEAKYAAAYHLAKLGRYQDASQLFGQLLEMHATKAQLAAVHYNLGNIFLLRGLLVNHNASDNPDGKVKDEAEYLINQAKLAYQHSLRLDHTHIDVKHNLDRVLRLLPETPSSTNEQEELGIVMGNIPSGLP